jgi:hypothetical protein
MRGSLRRHITYANVTATLALVLSLTAGAYAAVQVTGKNVVNGSLTGKDIRAESIRGKHVRGLTLADLQNGPGQYYLASSKGTGNGLAQATATCNGNDVMVSGGTINSPSTTILSNVPDGLDRTNQVLRSWTGRVQGTNQANPTVEVTVVGLCLRVPAQ